MTSPRRWALGGIEHIARHDQLEGPSPADEPRQPLRAAPSRDQAKVDFRLAEPGFLRGVTNVARHGQFASASERHPVHGGNDRQPESFDPPEETMPAMGHFLGVRTRQPLKFPDVGPGGKGPVAAPREYHHGSVRVVVNPVERFTELSSDLGAEHVQGRVVNRDRGHPAVLRDEDLLKRHASALSTCPETTQSTGTIPMERDPVFAKSANSLR